MTTLFEQASAGRSLWVGLFQLDAVDPDGPHCTLLFCGKDPHGDGVRAALQAVHQLTDPLREGAVWTRNLVSRVGGVARFRGSAAEGDPIVHLMQDVRIRQMKNELVAVMTHLGRDPRRLGLHAARHARAYAARDELPGPAGERPAGVRVDARRSRLWRGRHAVRSRPRPGSVSRCRAG